MPGITVASATATSARRGSREPREIGTLRLPQQLAGCILWLPRKEDLPDNRDEYDSDLQEDRCNHPVVVLSPYLEDGKVVYLMMTSLKGKNLETRFLNQPNVRREHLPIRPCSPHPDNGILLSLEDVALELRKRTYVKTRNQHRIRLGSLEAYDRRGPDYILSRKSYQDLIRYAKYTPPAPHPASNTVSSPRRIQQSNPATPITRERRGSYGEYVSVLRGPTSPPGAQHAPITSPTPMRYTRSSIPTERDSLLPSHGYSRHSYTTYPGSYPSSHPFSSPGTYPAYGYRSSAQAGYRGSEPPRPFDWATFWKRLGKLLLVIIAFAGAYATYRLIGWLTYVARGAGSMMKVTAGSVGNRFGGAWSILADLPGHTAQVKKSLLSRGLNSLGISV
ncbi:uncharacterized protein GGS22DRAFT_88221 [Annulohypoxylon maeteangense]|uniref:uncharacterized protein n=1 Tax=Annulohypoxylon maeteangense TaxID=1927788 RepID=UPI002008AC0E|nr:uncharacterized protein GGS22DRAFT_88221 [Annulohypoxylon maeteangense]KAI0887708.1 hypothetical protein GGS22DRAFT_88221 [Annulohypoxylon maeteangense]